MLKIVSRGLFLLFAAMLATMAPAQTYPTKPVQVVIGFGAGGGTDLIARVFAEEMGKRLGQAVVVENRPGANGLIAAQAVKRAAPDGYTLYGGSVTPFTPVFMKDSMIASTELLPVSIMALGDWFLVVRSDLGVNSLKDLGAYSKANPGKLRFASVGPANTALMAVIAKRTGIEFENIPYKTTDQTIAALLNNDCQVTLNSVAGFPPHLQSGKLRAIATLAPTRSALLPSVVPAVEQGVQLVMRFNLGFWAPLGTPRDVVARLNRVINDAVKSPQVVEKIGNASMIPNGSTPDELVRTVESEMKIYTEAANLTGMQPQ